jgi:negative regulator of flagellin synthesis FlgM
MTKRTTGDRSDQPQPEGKHASQPNRHQENQERKGKSDPGSVAVKPNSTTARLQELESRLTDKLPIDAQRINDMKNAIANGEYEVDAERIANKMIDFESSLKKSDKR